MSAAVAQDLLADAQIEIRNRLRVPESAQFDNLRAAQKTVNDKKAQVVCGNVRTVRDLTGNCRNLRTMRNKPAVRPRKKIEPPAC
jgi:hypothetical protein